LREAAETADPESSRYAIGCLQLRGKEGRIVATDGRQILAQAGFQFPWSEELLIPATALFSCLGAHGDKLVDAGLTGEWVTFGVGPWTIWLKIDRAGRFPKIDDLIRRPSAALSRLSLAEVDAQFLARMLPRLPCNDTNTRQITLDLNGQVLVRGRSSPEAQPVELVLVHSTLNGESVILNTNRGFLQRAVQFGFQEFALSGSMSPVMCDDGRRQFVWALLQPNDAIRGCAGATRIESHTPLPEHSMQSNPRRKRSSASAAIDSREITADSITCSRRRKRATIPPSSELYR
jgi:hypothetical protein